MHKGMKGPSQLNHQKQHFRIWMYNRFCFILSTTIFEVEFLFINKYFNKKAQFQENILKRYTCNAFSTKSNIQILLF